VSDYRLPRLVKQGTPTPAPHPTAPLMPHRPLEQWTDHVQSAPRAAPKRKRARLPKPVVMPHHSPRTTQYSDPDVTYPVTEERAARLVSSRAATAGTSPTDRRLLAIEQLLAGIAEHVGYKPPPSPDAGRYQPSAVEQADQAMDVARAFGRSGALPVRKDLE
jgi:hypothetical protein